MLVSGPVRCVRMVGERDGIQKVIYLFGDVHNSVGEQTSCEMTTTHNANPQKRQRTNYSTITPPRNVTKIEEYIFKQILSNYNKNHESKVDYFIEGITIKCRDNYSDGVYISNVRKLLNDVLCDNKYAKYRSNVNVHRVDFREWLPNYSQLINIDDRMVKYQRIGHTTRDDMDSMIKAFVEDAIIELDAVMQMLSHGNTDGLTITLHHRVSKKLEKIRKSTLSDHIAERLVLNLFEKYMNVKRSINDILLRLKTRNFITFRENMMLLEVTLTEMYLNVFDVNLLYRLMNPNITRAVIYAGATHICNYMTILTSLFGFNVTHISDDNKTPFNMNVAELNTFVKNKNLLRTQKEICDYLFPDDMIQCVDMSKFPLHFT